MLEAELQEIGKTIPRIVECLEDSNWYVRRTAAEGLSSLGAYRMCPSVSPPACVLNDVRSRIAGGDWQGHTLHH
jgi:HEAT repeat protein